MKNVIKVPNKAKTFKDGQVKGQKKATNIMGKPIGDSKGMKMLARGMQGKKK